MIDRLRELLGDAVRAPREDDAVHGVTPRAVVEPDSADACATLLGACSAEGWSVEVAGARSAGRWGRPVDAVDVLLRTTRIAGVDVYEPDDLTIGVRAGTALDALREHTMPHRQRVPLDAPKRSSVGGALARAAAGPLSLGWGAPRRQALGVELVTGDGRVLRVGGRVVKNVAGYDLTKLIVGSAGTLGVITRAHLRLLPVPAGAATHEIAASDERAAAAAARALHAGAVPPDALEVIGAPWRVVVHFAGSDEALAAAAAQVADAAIAVQATHARADDALPHLAALEERAALIVRASDLPDRLHATLGAAARLADGRGTIAGRAGDGVVRVLIDRDAARDVEPDRFASSVDALRDAVGGAVIIERAPAQIMRALDPWGPMPETVMRLMRELKQQFDPAGILQRGRWLA